MMMGLAVMSQCGGCGGGVSDPVGVPDASTNTNSETVSADAGVEGTYQVYDKETGEWTVEAVFQNPEFTEIETILKTICREPTRQARIRLVRQVETGHVIGLNRTDAGKLELGVNMKVDGEWFEANHYDVGSCEALIAIFRAFHERNSAIRSAVQWDEVVP